MPAALRSRWDAIREPLDTLGHTLLRVVCGGFLVAHGWPKWVGGVEAFAAGSLARRGLEPALPLAWMVVTLETVGGALVVLGLLTRPIAFVAAGHLAFIADVVQSPNGFAWRRGGREYPALWAAAMLAIALRGGGPWSLDHLLFRR
jgi:putative oxidoreductase